MDRRPCPAFAVLAILALLVSPRLAAQDLSVDRAELESSKDSPIVFVNYEGPQARIDSLDAIRGIGAALGHAMGAPGKPGRAGDARYTLIRAADPAVTEGFDADILVLGPGAGVDHVRNLRWIIAGFLETAWGYQRADAYTLATFVTVYNAVYRGDLASLGKRYKAVVMRELTAADAGLSTRYTEWPGASRILIPLSRGAKAGSVGAVDTGAISDTKVVESLQGEPGKGVDERQALVEVKEREVAEKQAAADTAQADADQAAAVLVAEKDRVAAERAALEADKAAAAATTTATAEGTAADTAAATEADTAPVGTAPAAGAVPADPAGAGQEASLTAREETVAAAEAAVAAQEETVAAKQEEAAAATAAVAEKQAEVAADRAAVSEDQKAVIAAEVAAQAPAVTGLVLIEVVDATYPYARILSVDPATGKLIAASTLNAIRGRSLVDAGDAYVAVAGKEGGTGAVRLVRILKEGLSLAAEGKTDIYAESPVWKFGTSFYAVAKGTDGKYYVARFDAALAELARSGDAINPWTFLVEGAGGLVAQAASGGFLALGLEDLVKLKDLKP